MSDARAKYVDFDVAVNGLAKIINESDMPEEWNKGMSAAMLALFRIPAADVRPVKRGHIEEDENTYLYCSECNCDITLATYVTPNGNLILRPNYCPNCGADMRQCPEDEAAEEMASVRWWLRREES